MSGTIEQIAQVGPRRPHQALRLLVGSYVGYDYDVGAPAVHRGLPSSELTVVLQFGRPLEVGWLGETRSRRSYWSLASGLSTVAAEIHQDGRQRGIQLGLSAAGARMLLGIPMAAVAAAIVPLDDVVPRPLRDLHGRLAELPTWAARYDALDEVLIRCMSARETPSLPAPRPELRWAWQQLVGSAGICSVATLADEVGWSRRHLSELFRAEFGLGPKQLGRVTRFQRSRQLVGAAVPLAEVAASCGYSDQAHLTREWRAMSGYTPVQWRTMEFPFLQDAGYGAEGQ